MRISDNLMSLAATLAAAVLLVAYVLLSPDLANAEPQAKPRAAADQPSRPATLERPPAQAWRPAPPTRLPRLEPADRIATLEALHYTLSEVGDGTVYVWHREGGVLSGIFKPTRSFMESSGRICRHLVVMLSVGARTKRIEGIACRGLAGRWHLGG
ncbi:MAG: hypothetical protein R3D31_04400 [Hyphomicrobiaceae bacterium]